MYPVRDKVFRIFASWHTASWTSKQLGGKNRGGFTIIELLIATSIFSVVLLVALNGFFQIGKIYYKGVATSQTQATAQKIMEDMALSLQFSSGLNPPQTSPSVSGRYFMCVGNTRYTYILGNKVSSGENQTNNFGLLRDSLPGNGGCGDPFNGGPALNNPSEMLGGKMRLSKVCITQATGANLSTSGTDCGPIGSPCNNTPSAPCLKDLWLVNVKVAYGDDDIFSSGTANTQAPSCNTGATNSQYCSVANLQTIINRGYGN